MSNLTKQEVNSCADEFIFIYNVVYFAQNIILNWKPEKAWFFKEKLLTSSSVN